jgi:hypothetical protein
MPGRSSAASRVASVGATPGSRRAATDSSRRLGHAAKKSPSSGTNGDDARGDAFPARDLADSLSAFAAVDFSAEKSMLENAGLTPPTRAVKKAAATPASGRRALGDLANLATDRSETTMTAEKARPAASASDDWSVTLNASLSPSAAVTERASMLPKSPAETLAERALAAAAGLRRLSVETDPATSPPADDAGFAAEPAMATPAAFSLRKADSPAKVSSRKKRSAERARVMASHAARVHDTPGVAGAASDENASPVDRVMLHYAEGKASDELLDALEHELRAASAVSASVTFLEDEEDSEQAVETKEPASAETNAANATDEENDEPPEPLSLSSSGSPFVRLVAEDAEDEDEPADGDGPPAGDPSDASGSGSGAGGSGAGAHAGQSGSDGSREGSGARGDGFSGGDDLVGGGGDDDAPTRRVSTSVVFSTASRSSLPPDAGVTLAHALGKWREAVAVAAIEAEARRVQTELAEIMREQAADCDDEVNKLSDENDLLTAALAASTSAGTRARWRLAAKAAVLSKRCEERKAEARRLRVKARKLESQLLKVEEHITSAAADFDRLRGRLSESNRETERARAGERDARARLAEAQAATSAAQARRARQFERDENVSPLAARNAVNAEAESAMRSAIRAELREEARGKIRAEVRAEMRAELRSELGDELRAEAEAEATAEASETARRVAEASAASGAVAACIDGLLRGARSRQMRQVASARKEATIRARANLERALENGVDTLRLGADPKDGGVDPLELVSLIAVHALERCEAHPHGDGARAFYRAARRVELAARACQPEYRACAENSPSSEKKTASLEKRGKTRTVSPLSRDARDDRVALSHSRSGSGSGSGSAERSSFGGKKTRGGALY